MKKLPTLALGIALVIASCQKSSVAPSSNSMNASSQNDAISAKSRTQLLTQHTWIYYKYYVDYIDSSNKGTLAYQRGRHNNSINLDYDFVKYHADGTFDEQVNHTHITGTWYFQDSSQTVMVVTSYLGTTVATILQLNNKAFSYVYTDLYGVSRMGQMIPFN